MSYRRPKPVQPINGWGETRNPSRESRYDGTVTARAVMKSPVNVTPEQLAKLERADKVGREGSGTQGHDHGHIRKGKTVGRTGGHTYDSHQEANPKEIYSSPKSLALNDELARPEVEMAGGDDFSSDQEWRNFIESDEDVDYGFEIGDYELYVWTYRPGIHGKQTREYKVVPKSQIIFVKNLPGDKESFVTIEGPDGIREKVYAFAADVTPTELERWRTNEAQRPNVSEGAGVSPREAEQLRKERYFGQNKFGR